VAELGCSCNIAAHSRIIIWRDIFIFLPLGLASATLSIVLFLEEELALLLSIEITDWRFELIAFACLSVCYGLLINSLLRRSRTQKRDINRY